MKKLLLAVSLFTTMNLFGQVATYRDRVNWDSQTNNITGYEVVLANSSITTTNLGYGVVPTNVINLVVISNVATKTLDVLTLVPTNTVTGDYKVFIRANGTDGINSDWLENPVRFVVIPPAPFGFTIVTKP